MAQNIGAVVPTRTAYEWATMNPVLVVGQMVYESDTRAIKVGDGASRYADLPYAGVISGTSEGGSGSKEADFADPLQRARWLSKIHGSDQYGQRARVASFGDSFTSIGGTYWTSWTPAAAARVARSAQVLEGQFYSMGFSPFNSTSHTGDITEWTNAAGFNPHNVQLNKNNSGDGCITFDCYQQYLDVHWWKLTGGTTYAEPQYSINGGARQNFTDIVANYSDYGIGLITAPAGTVRLYPPATDGQSSLISGLFQGSGWASNERGIEWSNWAWPGVTSGWVKDVNNHYSMDWFLKYMPADLVHLGIGGNDMVANVPIATMKQNYRDILANYRTKYNANAGLFTTTMPYCDLTYPGSEWRSKWDQYFDAVVEVTKELGGLCVDMRTLFPKQSEDVSLYISAADHHPSVRGYSLSAKIIADHLVA